MDWAPTSCRVFKVASRPGVAHETLQTLKLVGLPSFSEFSKLHPLGQPTRSLLPAALVLEITSSPPCLNPSITKHRGLNFENFETRIFVQLLQNVRPRNFKTLDVHPAPRIVRRGVFGKRLPWSPPLSRRGPPSSLPSFIPHFAAVERPPPGRSPTVSGHFQYKTPLSEVLAPDVLPGRPPDKSPRRGHAAGSLTCQSEPGPGRLEFKVCPRLD